MVQWGRVAGRLSLGFGAGLSTAGGQSGWVVPLGACRGGPEGAFLEILKSVTKIFRPYAFFVCILIAAVVHGV